MLKSLANKIIFNRNKLSFCDFIVKARAKDDSAFILEV